MTTTHERVDAIPVIIAPRKKMRVAELLDNHFPTNGHWTGLSLGWVTVVWLPCLLSEGDHRLSRVEPWSTDHQRPRRRCRSRTVKPRDCTDERLATGRDYVRVEEPWSAFECALNERVLRVDHLQPHVARVDRTPAAAFVTPAGLCQRGHSKDHRPDLPPLQMALAVLDPLGLPLTTTVVAGHTADDPLSRPEIAKVRQMAQRTGLTYVGDGTMAALGPRAEIVAQQDDSLCPLAATQVPEAALDRLREPVCKGRLKPTAIR